MPSVYTIRGEFPIEMTTPASDVVRTPMGPGNTPWAMQEVSQKGKGKLLRFEPTRKPRKTPWELPVTLEKPETILPGTAPPPLHGPPAWRDEAEPAEESPGPEKKKKKKEEATEGKHLVSAQNYAAIEAGAERYGLIDMGPIEAGTRRSLIVHARKNRTPHSILNTIRPGSVLFVKRGRRVGRTMQLRVRFTTPAKYYSPGTKMSTLNIAVDEVDWQSLIADVRHI